jgi:hypothetical protein
MGYSQVLPLELQTDLGLEAQAAEMQRDWKQYFQLLESAERRDLLVLM